MNCLLPIFSCFPYCKNKPSQKINKKSYGTDQPTNNWTQTELNPQTPMDIACTPPIKNDIRQMITRFDATIDSIFETTNNKLTSVEKKFDNLQDGVRTLFEVQNQRIQSLDQSHYGNGPGDNTLNLTFDVSIDSYRNTEQLDSNQSSPSQSPNKIDRPYRGLFPPAIQPSICFRPPGTANDSSLLSASTQTNVDEVDHQPRLIHDNLQEISIKLDTFVNQLNNTQSSSSRFIDDQNMQDYPVMKLIGTYQRNKQQMHDAKHRLAELNSATVNQSNDIKDIKQSFNDLNLTLRSLSIKLDQVNQTATDHYALPLGNMT